MTHTSADELNWFLSRMNPIVWRAQHFHASRFLRVLALDGLVVLFHRLRPEPVYLAERVWRDFPERIILSEQIKGLVRELVVRKMFISDQSVDLEELEKVRANALRLLDRPTILYLMNDPGLQLRVHLLPDSHSC